MLNSITNDFMGISCEEVSEDELSHAHAWEAHAWEAHAAHTTHSQHATAASSTSSAVSTRHLHARIAPKGFNSQLLSKFESLAKPTSMGSMECTNMVELLLSPLLWSLQVLWSPQLSPKLYHLLLISKCY